MKNIKREELIDIIKHKFRYGYHIDEQEIQEIMEEYGEDWFIEDGKWKPVSKCND